MPKMLSRLKNTDGEWAEKPTLTVCLAMGKKNNHKIIDNNNSLKTKKQV